MTDTPLHADQQRMDVLISNPNIVPCIDEGYTQRWFIIPKFFCDVRDINGAWLETNEDTTPPLKAFYKIVVRFKTGGVTTITAPDRLTQLAWYTDLRLRTTGFDIEGYGQ